MIGASGAVAGNIAAYVLLYPRAKVWISLIIPLPAPRRIRAGLLDRLPALCGVRRTSDAQIAWWAHIGGLVDRGRPGGLHASEGRAAFRQGIARTSAR